MSTSSFYTDDEEEDYFYRLDEFRKELDASMSSLAEKHEIEIIYYKSEDRGSLGEIDGFIATDLTATFQVRDCKARKAMVVQ